MMTYYETLGLQPNCSQDDIKKAYRSLAMKHHPDRGGDEMKFKEIEEAYRTLSDEQKRAEYDAGGSQQEWNPFGGMGGMHDIHEMFGFRFGPGFSSFHQQRRNRDLGIRLNISLKDSFLGKELEAVYQMMSGKQQSVVINIPPGIEAGQTIRYNGLGDDSIPGAPRGNLNVTVFVEADPQYFRRGDDICTQIELSPFDAMMGVEKKIRTIDDKTLQVRIRPGIEHGGEYSCAGMGFQNSRSGRIGNFIIIINIRIPAVTDEALKSKLLAIQEEINNLPQ